MKMSTKTIFSFFCLIFLISLHFNSILAKKHETNLNEHKKDVRHKKLDSTNLTLPELCSNRPNSILHHCAAGYNECLPSCVIPKPDAQKCFKTNDCIPRCLCHKGFVSELSNGEGECLKLEECQNKNCDDPNAELNRCIASIQCIPTCEHPKPPREYGCWAAGECSMNPRPRCICKRGFVSLEPEGQGPCIPLEECPNKEEIHEPAPPPLDEEEEEGNNVKMKMRRKLNGMGEGDGRNEENWEEDGNGNELNRICADPNASPQNCQIEPECIPSCQNPPDSMPLHCSKNDGPCQKANKPFCLCNPGYVNKRMDGSGKCIKLEDCVKKRKSRGKDDGVKQHQEQQFPIGPPMRGMDGNGDEREKEEED